MSGILVNFQTIQNASSEVRQTASRIQNQLDDLKAGVQRIASSWEGAAQQGYQARQAQWDAKAADLQQVLARIATALDNAAQSYQQTENSNSQIWA
ncbi:WXG100 family type VII secretion target [Kitasatospora sp. YST-16]|uniref:WXG100 family type VII secretion target n=1 Tax=unclassified Kitasatospora TaxID=2633591 RepID=UPI0004C2E178|nr:MULTISPECIES: WXG100 family type VII secretion target [unclassified Kitasatospora]WAL74084.1 WXG100 family type VII secretion target [Kitasatospora sp. YST-16]WNW40154.1 WXG100 family type VII secretion target [Streptomyces sp. Li-HN-5-13]